VIHATKLKEHPSPITATSLVYCHNPDCPHHPWTIPYGDIFVSADGRPKPQLDAIVIKGNPISEDDRKKLVRYSASPYFSLQGTHLA